MGNMVFKVSFGKVLTVLTFGFVEAILLVSTFLSFRNFLASSIDFKFKLILISSSKEPPTECLKSVQLPFSFLIRSTVLLSELRYMGLALYSLP